jgi:hypothetical protein
VIDSAHACDRARQRDLGEAKTDAEQTEEVGEALPAGSAILVGDLLVSLRRRNARTRPGRQRRPDRATVAPDRF